MELSKVYSKVYLPYQSILLHLKTSRWRMHPKYTYHSMKKHSNGKHWKFIAGVATCTIGILGSGCIFLFLSPNDYWSTVKTSVISFIRSLKYKLTISNDFSSLIGCEDEWLTKYTPSFTSGNSVVLNSFSVVSPMKGIWDWLFPWEQSKSDDPWIILNLTKSRNFWIRQMGVASLANKFNWDDYKYRYIAQACGHHTTVALARYPHASDQYFLPPPRLHPSKHDILTELRQQISKFPVAEPMSSCIQYYRLSALDQQIRFQQDPLTMDFVLNFCSMPGEEEKKRDRMMSACLEALTAYTTISQYAELFVENHGLAVLQRLYEENAEPWITMFVATILANLSQTSDLLDAIVETGWVHFLRKWSEDENAALSLLALTTLANLDQDWITQDVYQDIVLIHPTQRNSRPAHLDVVFVHGLRGGAVKTWRQRDRTSKEDSTTCSMSPCWPRDWLASDCPNMRIISIGYNSLLHRWGDQCPYEQDKRTLEGRSKELVGKLRRAGLGSRPIIWIGHSMGGLLIKQMLFMSDQNPELSKLASQTKGVVMYSVPHQGTPVIDVMMYAKYLLFPSVEVQEMLTTSPKLSALHEHFSTFMSERSIPLLSFGENVKTEMGRPLPKVFVVPLESSDPGFGKFVSLQANHINICKPSDEQDMIYQLTLSFIKDILERLT